MLPHKMAIVLRPQMTSLHSMYTENVGILLSSYRTMPLAGLDSVFDLTANMSLTKHLYTPLVVGSSFMGDIYNNVPIRCLKNILSSVEF